MPQLPGIRFYYMKIVRLYFLRINNQIFDRDENENLYFTEAVSVNQTLDEETGRANRNKACTERRQSDNLERTRVHTWLKGLV
ncbi:hypothetical protein CHS0354_015325 [Potamilus streckersoni]|uniref:Uncharacterized protein n=1 Tax=Potamilus streckersoni TaxID=2493646 RepID=A0AAE0T696_9BIVA|nr:hypothetical protein CHS0354_015325 [Potamilus streckersoni]